VLPDDTSDEEGALSEDALPDSRDDVPVSPERVTPAVDARPVAPAVRVLDELLADGK
jgi:hypothetical protein